MLPLWLKGGKVVHIPISNTRNISIPLWALITISIICSYLLGSLKSPFRTTSTHYPTYNHASYRFTHSRFRIDSSLFLPPPPPSPRPDYLPEPLQPELPGMVVPNSVHYVYGLKPLGDGQKGEELPYFAYLAMRSALLNLKPEKIYFHYLHLPTGPWWDLIEPHLTLIKTKVPETYLGRKLSHFAHKADVLRLLAMLHSGGIYLDIDVFVVNSFDDLMYFPTTLGMQMSPHSEATALEPQGLCNAVILSAPHASFVERWLASYETFDEHEWDTHSVNIPWEIARRYPDEIQVLSNRAFFYPMWHGNEIEKTHELDEHDFKGIGQYAYHAWESLAMRWLGSLSPQSIREQDNSFNKMVRPFVGPTDDQVYRAWKGGS